MKIIKLNKIILLSQNSSVKNEPYNQHVFCNEF